MIDVQGRPVSAEQVIATVQTGQVGIQVQRQGDDAPIDVLRQMLRHEASLRQVRVAVHHVDDNVLLVIPSRREPTAMDVHTAMNIPTGF